MAGSSSIGARTDIGARIEGAPPEAALGEIAAALQRDRLCDRSGDGYRIATDCLYPSNGRVTVLISKPMRFLVSDGGGALATMAAHGVADAAIRRALDGGARLGGLRVSNEGALFIPDIDIGLLPVAVRAVANTARDAAARAIDAIKDEGDEKLGARLDAFLGERFARYRERRIRLVGASGRAYPPDYVLSASTSPLIAMRPVVNNMASVNAGVATALDLRHSREMTIAPRLVYDAREAWEATTLSLLSEGAPVVAFEALESHLRALLGTASDAPRH